MDTTFKTVVGIVLGGALVLGALAFSGGLRGGNLGSVPGVNILPISQTPDSYMVLATSTPTNSTLLTADIDQESMIDMTLTQADGTLTFPASTSFPGIPNTGDVRTIIVRNATTTVGIDLTVAGNTGVALKRVASSTAMLIGDTDGKNTFFIDFVRLSNSDINMYLRKYED